MQDATNGSFALPARAQVRRWVSAAAGATANAIAVNIRFVDLREARALNRTYRERDYATNVLTFNYDAPPQSAPKVKKGVNVPSAQMHVTQSDIVVCPAVIEKEARAQKKLVHAHYAHMVVHGVLHAQGYDHERAADAKEMEDVERAVLKRFRIEDPYVER